MRMFTPISVGISRWPSSRLALLAPFLGVLLSVGCGSGDSVVNRVARCAELPGVAVSTNSELRHLVAIIRESGGTPKRLSPPSIGEVQDPGHNAAAALADCWSDSLRWTLTPDVDGLLESRFLLLDTSGGVPRDEARLSLTRFLDRHARLCAKLVDASERPRCVYDPGLRYGYFAALRFVDDTGVASRVAMLEAIRSAMEDDPDAAWAALSRALGWAERLGRVRRVEARVLAATLRAQALSTIGAMFRFGWLDRDYAEPLYARLRDTLADWPADRRMLTGDRAVAMHSYEAIRIGLLDRVLTGHEKARLRELGQLPRLEEATPDEIDRDEVNYLKAMAALIGSADANGIGDAAEPPFHQRIKDFEEATVLAGAPPDLFAATLFLADLVEAMRLTARDRAFCEAWCVALASVTDLATPPYQSNPVTGNDYEVQRVGEVVVVRLGDIAVDDVIVPVW